MHRNGPSEDRRTHYLATQVPINVDELYARRTIPPTPPSNPSDIEFRLSTNIDKEKNKCSPRINMIIVICIIAILCLAALAIGIYALVNSLTQGNRSNSNIVTTATTTEAVVCTTTPRTTYQYSSSIPDECQNYVLNTDRTRNIGFTGSINYCDNEEPFQNETSVWIRFENPAGIVVIKEPPVTQNRCGAIVSGWYPGQYPDSVFTRATSIVCFFENTNTCASCRQISITNCRNFYVFLLPTPPSCNYRYCTI